MKKILSITLLLSYALVAQEVTQPVTEINSTTIKAHEIEVTTVATEEPTETEVEEVMVTSTETTNDAEHEKKLSVARKAYKDAQAAYEEAKRAGSGALEDLEHATNVAKKNYISVAKQAYEASKKAFEIVSNKAKDAGDVLADKTKAALEIISKEYHNLIA